MAPEDKGKRPKLAPEEDPHAAVVEKKGKRPKLAPEKDPDAVVVKNKGKRPKLAPEEDPDTVVVEKKGKRPKLAPEEDPDAVVVKNKGKRPKLAPEEDPDAVVVEKKGKRPKLAPEEDPDAVVVEDNGKRPKLAPEEDPDAIVVDDEALVISVEKLQELQEELDKINDEEGDKLSEIEQKYNVVRRPVYVRRSDVIRTIPDFWLTAFVSHPGLCDVLNVEDEKIFKYLDTLDVEDINDLKSGYSITLHFNENPYFEDTKLTKTFTCSDEGTLNVTATPIKWKEGMDRTVKGGNHEKKGKKRPFPHGNQSFITWFWESDQEEAAELQDEVGEIIKNDLWPDPLKYFHHEADEVDSNDEDDDEEDSGESEDEEDDTSDS